MPLLHRPILIAAALAMGITAAHADGIGPGSPAPALDVATWYKGTPVKTFEPNKIYVVEFWATWCGPCKTSIPHITKLAQTNKDVTFIGVSIWEDDNGTNIKNFVQEMGDKMDYNIGYSGNKTGMSASWMQAAGQNGIPSAFIVKNGQIQWIGHPMTMEKPLEEIKAGKFDVAAFKVEFDKQAEAARAERAAGMEVNSARELIAGGKYAEAKTKLADVEKKYPSMKAQIDGLRFALLAKESPTEWEAKAKGLAAKKDPQSIQVLWMFAMDQTQPKGDLVNGAKAMDLAVGAAKENDLLVFYYGAMFFDKTKDYKKASALIDKAIAAIPNSQFKDNKDAKAALEKMRTDITARAKASSN